MIKPIALGTTGLRFEKSRPDCRVNRLNSTPGAAEMSERRTYHCAVNCPDSKHQSAFETFALYYYLKKSFFIHKKQLFYIPIFGQYLMKHNMVSIDRAGHASTMRKMITDVKKKLDSGSTIIIFPEGTRTKPGAKADYKTGFIGIYNTSKRKLQPVALNSGLFWQKGLKIIKRGHIIIEFLPQIDIGLDKKEVLNKVENTIESATNKLLN